jgi:ABC-type Fe3+-hydroxamate transport system substrate-binding protein
MKKLFLSLVAAGMLLSACNSAGSKTANSASTSAGSAAQAANAPVAKFEKESHDFGKIAEGDKVSYDFKFTNTGKSPLIITNARATCGCTTPTWPKTPIKPGESGIIGVTFNSAGKSGLQDKQITVTANTAPAETMVHLIGEVLKK